nr:glycosyltransferase 87 family protein [Nocardia sp. CNY236]
MRSADARDRPSRNDSLAAQLSTVIGGPVGNHALIGRSRFWTPIRVLLAFSVVFLALGWFGKAGCIQQTTNADGALTLDWSNGRQYVALCYSDTVPLYGAERLDEGAFPYKKQWTQPTPDGGQETRYMEYPVLSGLYQYLAMRIAKSWDASGLPGALQVVIYFNVVALGLSVAWLITVWASALLAGRRVWDAALIACSPLVIVHAFTNFDTLATAFAAAGLLAWARRRPVLAGVLLGLGGAAKLYPLLLLGPIIVLCLRAEAPPVGRYHGLRMRDIDCWSAASTWVRETPARIRFRNARPLGAATVSVAAALTTWVAVNLPIAVLYPQGWHEFFRLNTTRPADPDSLYNVISSFTGWSGFDGVLGHGQSPVILNAISLAVFAAACVLIGGIGLTAPRRPRLAQLCFLVVAVFLLTNKVWSPQYSLWLVPLAVLALPHRRLLLAWMTIDALVWVPRMFYYRELQDSGQGLPEQWFTATVILRDLAVVGLCALVVRQIYRPEHDLVRRNHVDDPSGGIIDHLPDRTPAWLPPLVRPRRVDVRRT